MTELFIFHPDNLARCCDMIMTREEIPKIDRKEGKERNGYSWPLKLIRVSVQCELKQRYSFNKYTLITYYAGGTRMLCWQARGSSRPLGNSCEISYGPLPVGTLEKLWFKKTSETILLDIPWHFPWLLSFPGDYVFVARLPLHRTLGPDTELSFLYSFCSGCAPKTVS